MYLTLTYSSLGILQRIIALLPLNNLNMDITLASLPISQSSIDVAPFGYCSWSNRSWLPAGQFLLWNKFFERIPC